MESAVRSPWIKSAITGRARNDALLASQDSQNSRQPTGIGRQNPAAGNGIFGCRDWRLKIGLRDRKGHRRPKEWNDIGENPHRNGLLGVGAGICGFVGLNGGAGSLAKLVSDRHIRGKYRRKPKLPLKKPDISCKNLILLSFPENDLKAITGAVGSREQDQIRR